MDLEKSGSFCAVEEWLEVRKPYGHPFVWLIFKNRFGFKTLRSILARRRCNCRFQCHIRRSSLEIFLSIERNGIRLARELICRG